MNGYPAQRLLLGLLLPLALWACSSDDGSGPGTNSTGGAAGAGGSGAGGSGGGPVIEHETEPNDGAAASDFDALELGHVVEGTISPAGDADIFRVPVSGGTVVEARLTPTDGSSLEPHLTVFDDGRGGQAAGDDYVKIVRATSGEVRIQWLGMGQGGYYLAVRDARNVDGQSVGGDGFDYELAVSELARQSVTIGPLSFSSTESGTLGFGGAIDLYTFQAQAYQNALIDMQASGDVDGRLTVYAEATADWIARNDNRSQDDPDPLLDAPLTEGGDLVLVVENIAEQASSLGYSLTASLQ